MTVDEAAKLFYDLPETSEVKTYQWSINGLIVQLRWGGDWDMDRTRRLARQIEGVRKVSRP